MAWLDALSDGVLQSLAGSAVFGRGVTYATGGAIQQLSCAAHDDLLHADAVVMGTQAYQAALDIEGDGDLQGDCDCPHAQDGHFCKHQVALALMVRSQLQGEAIEPNARAQRKVAAAAKRAQTVVSKRERLRAFLYQQSADRLADWVWQQAEMDRELMSAIKSWAVLEQAEDDWPGIKSAINSLLPPRRGFLDWMASSVYAVKAEPVLQLLQKHARVQPAMGREACEHALLRLYKVAEEADDSNGTLGGLVLQVQELLVDTLEAAPPPAGWVDRWFSLMEADPWGLWKEAEVLKVAGEAVRERYVQRVTQDWNRWLARNPVTTPRGGPRFSYGDDDLLRMRVRRRYLDALKDQGDTTATIEVMRSSAQDDHEWSQLIRYCLEQSRPREALQFAQQAIRLLGPEAWQCENLLLQCYEQDGWDAEALVIRRKRLEANPWNLKEYDGLLKAAQATGLDREAYRNELFAWAQRMEAAPARQDGPILFGGRYITGFQRAETGPDVSLRVLWLMHEGKSQEALELVQPPNRCQGELLWKLAVHLPEAQYPEAVQLLKRVFETVMPGAKSPYGRELELARDIVQRQTPEQAEDWLEVVRNTYKAKRNFIRDLPDALQ